MSSTSFRRIIPDSGSNQSFPVPCDCSPSLPLEREIGALQRDVRCGYVSKQAAETLYGAVFKPDSLDIDADATQARRDIMRAQGLPEDDPVSEFVLPFATPAAPEAASGVEVLTHEERTAFAMTCRCCS